jgi:hypothetical protein
MALASGHLVLVCLGDSTEMAQLAPKRNRLTPWYIGIAIVLAAVIFVGYQMWSGSCPAPTIIEIGVLTVIPIVYLVLMYLTLVSQK